MPTTTNYIWDEQDYLAETDSSNVVQTVYTNDPEQYGNLVSSRISSTTSYHHFDAIGSTRQLTNATGSVTDTLIYDAWGNVVIRTGSTGAMLQWIGEFNYYHDVETSHFYVRARSYDPISARWISPDTFDATDHANLYVAVRNGPLLFVDPSGTQGFILWKERTVRMPAPFLVTYATGPSLLTDGLVSYLFSVVVIIPKADVKRGVTQFWQIIDHNILWYDPNTCKLLARIQTIVDVIPLAKFVEQPPAAGKVYLTRRDTQGIAVAPANPEACWLVDNATVYIGFDDKGALLPERNSKSATAAELARMRKQVQPSYDYTYEIEDADACCGKCPDDWDCSGFGFVIEQLWTPFFFAFAKNATKWGE